MLCISSDDHRVSFVHCRCCPSVVMTIVLAQRIFRAYYSSLCFIVNTDPYLVLIDLETGKPLCPFSFLYRFHKLVDTLLKKILSVYRLWQLKIIHYLCFYILLEGYRRLSKTSPRSHTNIILEAVTWGFILSGK